MPLLRETLIEFIKTERVRSQLREAASRIRTALDSLSGYYENQLADRGVYPPFANSWEQLQERRYENVLVRQQKELPRAFHGALLDLSNNTNGDARFRNMLRPTLSSVKGMVQDSISREVENLLDNYGTEYWDDRDVTYDNLIWGTSGIEIPLKRILFQVELVMQEAVSQHMPRVAQVMARELTRTLQAHEIFSRLERASYEQPYTYTLPGEGEALDLQMAYERLVGRVGENFRHVCRQATMYELMKPERSVNYRLEAGDASLTSGEALLNEAVNRGTAAVQQPVPVAASANNSQAPAEDEFVIRLLDEPADEVATPEFDISFGDDDPAPAAPLVDLEASYADKLDTVSSKVKRIFGDIINDLFNDDELLPRLRRLFWLEATKAERDFNNSIIKPMLKQHDRNLQDPALREAMEMDLESVSDLEELMRVWEGLDKLQNSVVM